MFQKLKSKNLTVAVAESCTGGAISTALTEHEGASKWFVGSLVTYQQKTKENLLQIECVDPDSITCAELMAVRLKKYFDADIYVSCTGLIESHAHCCVVMPNQHKTRIFTVTLCALNTRRDNQKIVVDEIFRNITLITA